MATGAPDPYYTPDDDDAQQYSPAVLALAGTGRPQPQAPTVSVPSQPQSPAPSPYTMPAVAPRQPMPQAPVAPTYDMAQRQRLSDQDTQAKQPIDQSQYRPKWYERLAGGLAAAGIGYRDPAEGVKVGSSITNRRYDAAEAAQQQKAQAADAALSNFDKGTDAQAKAYDLASQQYGNVVAGRRLGDEEGNQDWLHQYDTAKAGQDQSNSNRTFNQEQSNTNWSHDYQNKQFGETQKRDQSENAYRQGQLGIDSSRLKIEQQKADQDRVNAKGDALKRQIQMNRLNTARQSQLTALDADDPKSGEAGYLKQRQNLWMSAKNPDTDEKWKPGEREQAVAALDADHADKKNAIEANFAQEMQTLGQPVVPVTYAPDGKTVVNNSNGAPPQQGAPQQAAAPQQGGRRPTPAGMALVQKPDGSTVYIPKANIAGAQKLGGKVLDQGQ